MIREFRQFLFRGNIVDLAVAVVIGTAFVAVVNAFIAGILTPIVAAIFGKPDFSSLSFHINGSTFLYGSFLNALFTFFTVALVIFFLVVKPMNALTDHLRPADDEPVTRECPECLSVIPGAARRCSHCTSQVTPVTAT
ncbi:MAG TPA: large conductance mechanosensitive channel protein MscL [Gaiellales bacterium]|nr:large conductance mechanosensitive channel protein MscL [Gaiellales bacterium]